MSTRFLSDEQLERLWSFPDIGREELNKYFTLTPREHGFLDGPGRGPEARLGLAVQLCTLPWLGYIPDDLLEIPQVALLRLAGQMAVFPGMLEAYDRSTRKRPQTRSDHLKLVMKYLTWKNPKPGSIQWKELEQFLLDRAMEHDTPSLLFQQAVEHLQAAQVVRPGAVTLMELVTAARNAAAKLTTQKVGHLLTRPMRSDLDRLLVEDLEIGTSRLRWLTTPAAEASAPAIGVSIDKLMYLRAMDAHQLDLSMLPRERRRFLATMARRSTVQGLKRREERRYPILLALVAQSAVDQLDEVIALFDQAVSARESHAKAKTDEALAERAKKGEARQLLMGVILPVLVDPGIDDDQVGGILRERIGMDKLREVSAINWKPLPRDHGRLAALEASYTYLRRFTPKVLSTVDFHGGPGAQDLMTALRMLKELNRTGGRKVPAGAPTSFVPARYADYLAKARKAGDDTAFRHYWELCVVLALRDGLRSGDVFVPGSRRYADPGTYLFTPEQWEGKRAEFCQLVRKPAGVGEAIDHVKEEFHQALETPTRAHRSVPTRPHSPGSVRSPRAAWIHSVQAAHHNATGPPANPDLGKRSYEAHRSGKSR
ncbi:DUF4158 domain-containing protein [Streptosporangium sp. LJ11]|uniref:DUF4158 domain-containing protein n=1 Tax=Streptosporangium sp. LJ11 TaxID=3436927 RepID=UPI003F79D1C7